MILYVCVYQSACLCVWVHVLLIPCVLTDVLVSLLWTVDSMTWTQLIGLYPHLVEVGGASGGSPQLWRSLRQVLLQYSHLLHPPAPNSTDTTNTTTTITSTTTPTDGDDTTTTTTTATAAAVGLLNGTWENAVSNNTAITAITSTTTTSDYNTTNTAIDKVPNLIGTWGWYELYCTVCSIVYGQFHGGLLCFASTWTKETELCKWLMSELFDEPNDSTMKLLVIMELPYDKFCGYGYWLFLDMIKTGQV